MNYLEQQQSQIMQHNLERLVKNQNYFSCFLEPQNCVNEQGPMNPFKKRMFDKKLRRSTMSCGHWGASERQNDEKSNEEYLKSSKKRDSENVIVNDDNSDRFEQGQMASRRKCDNTNSTHFMLLPSTHKPTLAQSRHSDPFKSMITQTINSFRHQLSYLQQKLHAKVEHFNQLEQEERITSEEKQKQVNFMIETLEKIVGFMIENCVNLEEVVCNDGEERVQSRRDVLEREMYQVDDDQEGRDNEEIDENDKENRHMGNSGKSKGRNIDMKLNSMQKSNSKAGRSKMTNLPQTYFINDQIHTTSQSNSLSTRSQSKPHPNNNKSSHIKQKTISRPTHTANISHYHSHKQQPSFSSEASRNEKTQGQSQVKSIYQTVLEERHLRMMMKKGKRVM